MTSLYLADACAIIVYLLEPAGSMGPAGTAAMNRDVLVSPITVWEIGRKTALGKLPAFPGRTSSLALYLAERGFRIHPLTWADAERANLLPAIHQDPMDRMLVAQALNANLTIVTIDRLFEDYGVRTVW